MLRAARGEWPIGCRSAPRPRPVAQRLCAAGHHAAGVRARADGRADRGRPRRGAPPDLPEFLKVRTPDDTIDRGLGIFRLRGLAYRAELTNVDRVVRTDDEGATIVEYHTPVGSVSCRITFTEEMLRSGASITWPTTTWIKARRTTGVVGHIFRNIA